MPVVYPDQKITDKKRVVKWIEGYLTEEDNNIGDVGDLICKICPSSHTNEGFIQDIAYKMQRTGKYDLKIEHGGVARYLVWPIPRKKWNERKPFLFAFSICAITIGLTVLGEWIISPKEIPPHSQQDTRQDSLLRHLTDTLKNYQLKPVDTKSPKTVGQ